MTYKDQFVAEVKSNGQILRVKDGAVYLPFGSEYTILLKNLNSRRASVKISIDGQDVLDNSSLILDANSSAEIEGFLRGNVARNRFKFIQKTKQIVEHRGDRPDDGLIRIEFAFEKPLPEPKIVNTIKEVHHYYSSPFTYTYYGSNADWSYNSGQQTCDSFPGEVTAMNCSIETENMSRSINQEKLGVEPNADEGITVKGSECNQQFRYASIGQLEQSNVIIIQLKGMTETGNQISQPVTVQAKLTCSSCGVKSKSSFKFCPNCGTFLE